MITLLRLDAQGGKLPCGCPVWGTKVYARGGRARLENVVSVEAFRLERDAGVVWHVVEQVMNDDGSIKVVDHDGMREPALVKRELRDVELRCKHHPEYAP